MTLTRRLGDVMVPWVEQRAMWEGMVGASLFIAILHVDIPAAGSLRLRRTGWPTVAMRQLGPGLFLASVPYLGSGDADLVVRYSADRSQLRIGDSRARRVRFTRLS